MALTSYVISPPGSRIILSKSLPSGFYRPTRRHFITYPTPASLTLKAPTISSSLGGPPRNLKANANYVRRKLLESVPDSVTNFPWKETKNAAMQRLVIFGQEALKWSLSAIFILSCVADTIFTVSRNKELLIPVGLFFGCMTADFLSETSKEFFQYSEKKKGMRNMNVWSLGCFIVILKLIAIYVLDRPVFLLHAANGGLIQLVWRWRNSSQSTEAVNANETSR